MKKKKKEIQEDQPHILDLDQEIFKSSNILTNNVEVEGYRISDSFLPFDRVTNPVTFINESFKNPLSDMMSTVPTAISFFDKDSYKNNLLDSIHSPISALQDSIIVGHSNSISPFNLTKGLVGTTIVESVQMPYLKSNSAFNWVMGSPARYEPPIEGQIVNTVSEVLVEIQTFRQEFYETRAEVKEVNENIQELIDTLKDDIKKKDAMIEELLDYFRDSKSKKVRKISINYDFKTCLLNIDDIPIQLKSDTKQAEFCRVFFRNKRSYERVLLRPSMTNIMNRLGLKSLNMMLS